MDAILSQLTLIDDDHDLHGELVDIRIEDGYVAEIGRSIDVTDGFGRIAYDKAYVSLGWMDIGTRVGEPGYEQIETLDSISAAAARGGFTGLALFPNTYPVLDTKAQIEFIKKRSEANLVDLMPIGAISKGCKGKEITEMIDMQMHGAIGFSDGINSIDQAALMRLAMEYSRSGDALIIHHPIDLGLAKDGLIHEGAVSMRLGCVGIPTLAETLMLQRDLGLRRYTDARLLVHTISSGESVQLIEDSRHEKISSSIAYLNLVATDEQVGFFDTSYKVLPPLRTASDRLALAEAIKKNQVPIICTNHRPVNQEHKDLEFAASEFGATGLETCYSALMTHQDIIDLPTVVKAMSKNPRKALGLSHAVSVGDVANLTIFNDHEAWVYDEKSCASISRNNPYWGKNLRGKVKAVINNNKITHID